MAGLHVRASCERIVRLASHVTINDAAIAQEMGKPDWDLTASSQWGACDFHFCDGTDLTAQYVLVLDALNFCFWPLDGYEYHHLAGGLKQALLRDSTAFAAEKLAVLTSAQLTTWLQADASQVIPLVDERARLLREVGAVLLAHFDGQAANLVRAAHQSAVRLVQLVTAWFPGFRDHSVYQGAQAVFYKRAQIFVGDVWGAFEHTGLGLFTDMDQLTCFADYRIPQLLRPLGILTLSAALAQAVDDRQEIPAGSEQELELRAATVIAVERMCSALRERGRTDVTPVLLDWLLWQRGERLNEMQAIPPHHRVLTIYY